MPALTLQVVSIDAALVAQPTLHAFDDSGGSIGRDDSNFLALPDKHRRVSRLHATISFPGGMPTITNSSTSLPLSVGEQQLDGGDSMLITQGALIEIGPYILQAHVGTSTGRDTLPPQPARSAIRHDPSPTTMPDVVRMDAIASARPPVVDLLASDPLVHWPEASVGASSVSLLPPSTPVGNPWPDQIGTDLGAFDSAGRFGASAASDPLASFGLPSVGQQHVQFSTPSNADPFADLLAGIGAPPGPPPPGVFGSSTSSSPNVSHAGLSADPLAAFGASLPTQGSSLLGRSPTYDGGTGGAANGLLPDDFNAFHMPSSSSRNAADPLAELMGSRAAHDTSSGVAIFGGTPSIDSLFLTGGQDASHASLFGIASAGGGDGTIEGLIRSGTASDPLSLFDMPESAPAQSVRPMRNDSMEVGSAFAPPLAMMGAHQSNAGHHPHASVVAAMPVNALAAPAVPPTQAVAPSALVPAMQPALAPAAPRHIAATAASAPGVPASPDVLTDAFLRGAGLAPGALPHGLTPEIMTIVGSLLRSATAGAVDMLAARAATKREVQASVTIISVQANNPLKFLPNADSALLQLLGKKMPGFMRADVAMRDAFDDLRAHEVGVIAGTRAALTEVLGKFDPAMLGDKLAKGSVLESLMPSARKAKLWDMYLERYLQIRREAEDDFQSIFGRAFVQAYERETARIKGESPIAGGE